MDGEGIGRRGVHGERAGDGEQVPVGALGAGGVVDFEDEGGVTGPGLAAGVLGAGAVAGRVDAVELQCTGEGARAGEGGA